MEHDVYGITRWGDDLVKSALEGKICEGIDLVELSPIQGDIVSPFTAACLLQRLMELV